MEGVIRKIIIGRDPKDAMAYYVGMRAGSSRVSAIVNDEAFLYRHGKNKYLVYLEEEDGRGEVLKAAMQQILDEGDPDSFTSDGLPKQSVIKAVFGEQITSDERDEVWAEIVIDKED